AAAGSNRKQEVVIAFSLAWFQHTFEHRNIFKLIVGSHAWDIVRPRMEEMLFQLIQDPARPRYKKKFSPDGSFELFVHFVGTAFLSVVTWWLNQKNPVPPEQINSHFRQLILPILDAHLS